MKTAGIVCTRDISYYWLLYKQLWLMLWAPGKVSVTYRVTGNLFQENIVMHLRPTFNLKNNCETWRW